MMLDENILYFLFVRYDKSIDTLNSRIRATSIPLTYSA